MIPGRNTIRGAGFSFVILSVLTGCAATPTGSTVGVMPGPGKSFAQFQTDSDTCKTFAGGQVQGMADAANRQAAGTGLLTTVLATGLGAAIGGAAGNAGAGAAVGAATGAAGGTALGGGASDAAQGNIQQQYDNAFSQCMYAKGNQVPGFAPVVASGRPAPDPLVRSTQSELVRLGYLGGPPDGFMGGRTRSAIETFESTHGLAPDGVPSSHLLAMLQSTPSNATAAASPPNRDWVAPVASGGGSPAATPTATGWVPPVK